MLYEVIDMKCEWCSDEKAIGVMRGEHVCSTCMKEYYKQPDDGRF